MPEEMKPVDVSEAPVGESKVCEACGARTYYKSPEGKVEIDKTEGCMTLVASRYIGGRTVELSRELCRLCAKVVMYDVCLFPIDPRDRELDDLEKASLIEVMVVEGEHKGDKFLIAEDQLMIIPHKGLVIWYSILSDVTANGKVYMPGLLLNKVIPECDPKLWSIPVEGAEPMLLLLNPPDVVCTPNVLDKGCNVIIKEPSEYVGKSGVITAVLPDNKYSVMVAREGESSTPVELDGKSFTPFDSYSLAHDITMGLQTFKAGTKICLA